MANITNGTVSVTVSGGVGPYQYTLLNAGNNLPVPQNAYPTFQNPVNSVVSNSFTFGNATDYSGNSGVVAGDYKIKIVDGNGCETFTNVLTVNANIPSPTATPFPTAVPTATPVPTVIPTATPVPTAVPTATPVPDPTATAIPDPTATPVPDPTATAIPDPTATPVPTAIPSPTFDCATAQLSVSDGVVGDGVVFESGGNATGLVPAQYVLGSNTYTATIIVPETDSNGNAYSNAGVAIECTATAIGTAIPDPTATPVPTAEPTATPTPLLLQPQRKVVSGWNLMAGEPEEFINGLLNKTEEEHRDFFCNAQYISGVSHQAGDEARPYVLWTDQDEALTMPEVGNVFYADQQGTQYFTNSGFLWWNSGSPTSEETNYYWVTIGSEGIATSVQRWTECIPDPTATPVPTAIPTATPVPPTATPVPDPTATAIPDPTATPVPTATPAPEQADAYYFHLGSGGYPYAQDLIGGTLYKADNNVAANYDESFADMLANPGSYEQVNTLPAIANGTSFIIPISVASNFYWLAIPDTMGIGDLTVEKRLELDGAPADNCSASLAFVGPNGVPYTLYKLNTVPMTGTGPQGDGPLSVVYVA